MSTRAENPRTIGLDLRGEELARFKDLCEEMRAQGCRFRSKAGSGPGSRRVSGPGYRQPRVHKHHRQSRPATGRD